MGNSSSDEHGFITEYTHYRTKKLMRAKDYGYKAWPFGRKKGKKKKGKK
ncbi:MAG: hypothetical protein ABUK01_18970 [Leptospirales bacterium]